MTETTLDRETLTASAGTALPQAAERSGQPDSADSTRETAPFDPTDTTSFLQGAKAIIGKAAWSAGRMSITTDAIAMYEHAKRVRDEREAQEARELAHLAEWNTQMTMVGGVAMTNEEAQDARQRVIDHDETYAQWAVDHGYLSADEKDDFKSGIRRKKDLEDKRGRGTMTEAEAAEEAALDRSHAGRAGEAATAESYVANKASHDIRSSTNDADVALRVESVTPAFSSSPFQAYSEVTSPVANTAKTKVAPAVKATGLDL